jgi:hypothetical protein
MSQTKAYTTLLAVGQGILDETRTLLHLWEHGMPASTLYKTALASGSFPNISARRLRNLIVHSFAPRFLVNGGQAAYCLKALGHHLTSREFAQLAFLYTCRAQQILADFVIEVYWERYASGSDSISNRESRDFVARALQEGRAARPWSEKMVDRVAGYLTGTCADLGLLEDGPKRSRRYLPYRIEPVTAAVLAYDLHFAGHGDNAVMGHRDWKLFGLGPPDVLAELKRLALKRLVIVQAAANIVRIGWNCKNLEELVNALAQGQLQ